MILKNYQQAALATLQRFLQEARIVGAKAAYDAITSEPEVASVLRNYRVGYRPVKALPDVPQVCLRLPTGGGKTILAAHSIAVARDAYLDVDYPLVLWLVPTNTIRQQTVEALKNPRHPYRQVLDEAFAGRVRVFDIGSFTEITQGDLGRQLCVVVGTIQTLRVTNTDGRKVYAHNENLEPHFARLGASLPGLERRADGAARYSFANLLHVLRPLVIMDEAHKAGSKLSQEVYERINPAALIEFTATPKGFNNILHSTSAQALKDAEMIKMPVALAEADSWQGAVNSAILKRAELAEYAARDRQGYIRPIVLFQAQKKNEEVTVEVLRQHLIDNEGIAPEKIAVATGAQRELDGINLFDPACPIEYVITIEALKEGWDCSFAYVFCSVANIRSATDAEQLLGRVLRMPYAQKRKEKALNRSYARLVSKHFAEAANALRDKLVDMGFEESEAEDNIEAEAPGLDFGVFGRRARAVPQLVITLPASMEEARAIAAVAPAKIHVVEDGVQLAGYLKPAEKEALFRAASAPVAKVLREEVASYEMAHAAQFSAAERGEPFVVPRLMAHVQGELVWADTDVLNEYHSWSLADYPARLEADEFKLIETTHGFEIDIAEGQVRIASADSAAQLGLAIEVEGWTEGGLVSWLDRKLRDPWIAQAERLKWLGEVVDYLLRVRQLPLAQLMRCKYVLARKLGDKIDGFRKLERARAWQQELFGPEAALEVSFDEGFAFVEGMYEGVPKYRGKYRFQRHFLGPDEVPAFDGKPGGEEEQCAFVLDGLPGVRHWLRNVERHKASFFLPTATDRFYPDFVAELEDGRLLVVEYKGADRISNADSREKARIGEAWARASGGRGVFAMVTIHRDAGEVRAALLAATGN